MSAVLDDRPVHVRVPATSANLGPGFDALGLALGLYDDVTVTAIPSGLRVEVIGEGAGEVGDGEGHLVVRALRHGFAALGVRPGGLRVSCVNRIPHARGLGSSSAAIVAGLVAARALAGPDRGAGPDGAGDLDGAALLRLAAELEGHPDNVAACLYGGLTIAWTEFDGARAARLDPVASLTPVVLVPPVRGLTARARAALPPTVSHADAAFSAGRAALLVHALTRDPGLLLPATEDRLHQHHRAASMPASAALIGRLRARGVPAVLSGAGPTVLALPPPGRRADTLTAVGPEVVVMSLPVDARGARAVLGNTPGRAAVAQDALVRLPSDQHRRPRA